MTAVTPADSTKRRAIYIVLGWSALSVVLPLIVVITNDASSWYEAQPLLFTLISAFILFMVPTQAALFYPKYDESVRSLRSVVRMMHNISEDTTISNPAALEAKLEDIELKVRKMLLEPNVLPPALNRIKQISPKAEALLEKKVEALWDAQPNGLAGASVWASQLTVLFMFILVISQRLIDGGFDTVWTVSVFFAALSINTFIHITRVYSHPLQYAFKIHPAKIWHP